MAGYVVTGATGLIGAHLVDRLAPMGRVLGIARRPVPARGTEVQGLVWDLARSLPPLPEWSGAVFVHAGASMNGKDPEELWQVNVAGTRHVLEAAVRCGARHFIFFSTGGVYGYAADRARGEDEALRPIGAYGHTKRLGEELAAMYADLHRLPVTILRLYFPAGPGQTSGIFPLIRRAILEGRPLTIQGSGSPRMNPIHAQDVAEAVALAQPCPGVRTYNLCGDEVVSFLELVRRFEAHLQRPANLIAAPEGAGDLLGDNGRIKQELGWQPRKRLDDMVRALA